MRSERVIPSLDGSEPIGVLASCLLSPALHLAPRYRILLTQASFGTESLRRPGCCPALEYQATSRPVLVGRLDQRKCLRAGSLWSAISQP